jgi:hypothetical protein
MLSLWICASLFICARVSAAPATDPVEQLRRIESFAVCGIGIAGTTSEGETALRNLLEHPAATRELKALLTKATLAGQLYAFLGLRLHDRAAFAQAIEHFDAPNGDVETIGGCIVSRLPFKQLLDRIKAGQYDAALSRPVR